MTKRQAKRDAVIAMGGRYLQHRDSDGQVIKCEVVFEGDPGFEFAKKPRQKRFSYRDKRTGRTDGQAGRGKQKLRSAGS